MNDDKIIDKLRKVLALTNNPNEHEAQAAAETLQRLLTQYNLGMADLEKRGKALAPGVKEQEHDLGKAAFKWKLNLARDIAEHYYCIGLVDDISKTVKFIGRPENVESLQMLYKWLIDQIKQISAVERRNHFVRTNEHVDPLRWQVNFGLGVVSKLGQRLRELKARQNEAMSRNDDGDVTALAVHHTSEANDYMEKKYGYRKDGKETATQRAYRERYEQREAEWQRMKVEDPTAYYTARPWEKTDDMKTEAELAAERKEREREAKKEAARERRRRNSSHIGRWRPRSEESERKDAQAYEARSRGRESADKVNLQPFVTGDVDRKKVV